MNWPLPPGPVAPGLQIGLLGGSFNPAHQGHVHVSETALKRLGLDYVWWLVSPQNPLKSTGQMAPLAERLASARATARHPRLCVSDLETQLGTRYTADTLSALKSRFPHVHFVWLMGSDNLEQFDRWQRWQEIAKLLPIAVVIRPGHVLAALKSKAARRYASARVSAEAGFARAAPPAMILLDGQRNPLSATAIRAGLVTPRPA